MKFQRSALATASILCLLVLPSWSQDKASSPAGSRQLTIEELFLQSVEFQILRQQAFSDDLKTKLDALTKLKKMVDTGITGDSAVQVEFVLEYLAMEGVGRTVREDRRVLNNFPEVRRQSAQILGILATKAEGQVAQGAKRSLISILLNDTDKMVKAEAVYALGGMSSENNMDAVQAIVFALESEDITRPDNNFGYAVVLALERVAKQNSSIKDPSFFRALVRISQGNYLKTVKEKADSVLKYLAEKK
jgi:hypothetical protein